MDSLSQTLYQATKSAVEQFIDRMVEAKVVSDKEKALAVWNTLGDELKIIDAPKKSAPKKVQSKRAKKDDDDTKKCQYIYVKGDREGDTCGAKISDESETGNYCKKHLAHEKKGEEKTTTTTKKSAAAKRPAKKKQDKEADDGVHIQEQAPVFSVKMNKFKLYEHESTGFLFDRKTEEVYGRQLPDGKIAPLTVEDIENCKRLGFKFRTPERMVSNESKDESKEEIADEPEIAESDEEDEEEEDEEDS